MAKPMKYRRIDPEGSKNLVRRQLAMQAEEFAFSAELEAERQARTLKEMKGADPETVEQLQREQEKASDDARAARKRADALMKRAGLTSDDDAVIDAHHDFIGRWMEGIESEHVNKTVQLEVHEGRGAKAKEEKQSLERDVEVLEQAHELAVERFESLDKVVRERVVLLDADTEDASGDTEEK